MKNIYFYLILLFSLPLTACNAQSSSDAPKGWKLLKGKALADCIGDRYSNPNAVIKECGGTRPPPAKEELIWLKGRMEKRMIRVQGGEFIMGDFGTLHAKNSTPPVNPVIGYWRKEHDYDKPKIKDMPYEIGKPYFANPNSYFYHDVQLDSYSMTAYMIEEQEYNLYAGAEGKLLVDSSAKEKYQYILDSHEIPARVTWEQAQGFCQWLGKQVGQTMSLPTEAQWEYAARNRGEFRVFPTNNGYAEYGDNIIQLSTGISFSSNNDLWKKDLKKFQSMPPNPLGFYNMQNIGEWMSDWYTPDYYQSSPKDNPKGPDRGALFKDVELGRNLTGDDLASMVQKGDITSEEALALKSFMDKENNTPVKSLRGNNLISLSQAATFARGFSLPSRTFAFRCATVSDQQ